jgi:hypothetical protein
MTARKPTSDEQFEYEGPKTKLDQLFDHHGFFVLTDDIIHVTDELGAEEEKEDNG